MSNNLTPSQILDMAQTNLSRANDCADEVTSYLIGVQEDLEKAKVSESECEISLELAFQHTKPVIMLAAVYASVAEVATNLLDVTTR